MSDSELSTERESARGFTPRRVIGLLMLIALGVGGYAASQLGPVWFGFLSGRETAALRRQAVTLFVDGLLIVYPLALLVSAVGAVLLIYLGVRSRSRRRSDDVRTSSRSSLQARLLLLCFSTLVSLAALEMGAAVWRSRLNRSPDLPAVVPPRESGKGGVPDGSADPGLPTRFQGQPAASTDAARTLRILVIGESSAHGEPYHPWLSVAQIVAWRLEKVFPGRSIEVDMWAIGGATLKIMHERLAGLTYRPDALMVYVGHNEFQGRYAWMRDVDHYLDDHLAPLGVGGLSRLTRVLRFSPLCQLIDETRERQRLDSLPPRVVTRELVDRPLCTVAESKAIADDFRRRLESIAVYCESIGTLPIYVIPPGNDAGWDPSRSVLAAETPRAERDAFAREVMHARALEARDPAEARRIYTVLVKRHPEFAETHYRLARLLEQTGLWGEARDQYVQARELDGMPLRCPEPLRQAYHETAARHPSIVLVNGPRVLEAKSRHGIVDDAFFHDAQHPNLHGYVALAEDLMSQLGQRRAFAWPADTPVPVVDAEVCARHFGIDATRWAKVGSRDVWFFRAAAYIRYDPRFRNERASEYLRAVAAIGGGRAPAEAELPGWAMPPPLSSSHRITHRTSREP